MADKNRPLVIALEEHYWDAEVAKTFVGESRNPALLQRLDDLGALRIKEMDEAGIDIQVLSHGAPSTQRLDAATAVPLAKRANDRLHEAVRAHPDRFAAFAVAPDRRSESGRGRARAHGDQARLQGCDGARADERRLLRRQALLADLRACAGARRAALPASRRRPCPRWSRPTTRTTSRNFPQLLTAAWGYTVETATQGIRMVLSGVFDQYPRLKIILGHLGESLPFSAWRINMALSRGADKPSNFRDTFCEHFWITTSGNFSTPALHVLHHGDGRRPDPVLGRLPLRPQSAGDEMDGGPAA